MPERFTETFHNLDSVFWDITQAGLVRPTVDMYGRIGGPTDQTVLNVALEGILLAQNAEVARVHSDVAQQLSLPLAPPRADRGAGYAKPPSVDRDPDVIGRHIRQVKSYGIVDFLAAAHTLSPMRDTPVGAGTAQHAADRLRQGGLRSARYDRLRRDSAILLDAKSPRAIPQLPLQLGSVAIDRATTHIVKKDGRRQLAAVGILGGYMQLASREPRADPGLIGTFVTSARMRATQEVAARVRETNLGRGTPEQINQWVGQWCLVSLRRTMADTLRSRDFIIASRNRDNLIK